MCARVVVLLSLAFATLPGLATEGLRPVAGTLDSIGSETLAGLMLRWGEALEREHPGVRLQLQASGSATAPAALAAGTTRLGPMSRPMSAAERDDFRRRQGHEPLQIPVAMDALAVFVHRHNPLASLSLAEVDAIFSDTRRCGEANVGTWRDLAIPGATLTGPIDRHGRNSVSGSHGIFRGTALCGGDFRLDVNEHPGSSTVVAAVASAPGGIGYAGLGYVTPGVRAVPLRQGNRTAVAANAETTLSGDYPLSRTLYLYVNLPPGERLPGPERAFVDLVLSPRGQAIVVETGFVALPDEQLQAARRQLGLAPPPR
ncbi:phosphate ABC transporter substrate-binding protein [Halomonas sp. PA5]|nr:phosphate ABC transporter substrate-binding protein [Halomonas sp. PA5]